MEKRLYAPVMPILIVAVLSLLVGCAVYVGTVRGRAAPPAAGFGQTEPDAANDTIEPGAPAPGYAYLQVSTQVPGIRERLQGLVGVIVLLWVGAAALAFGLYELGHLINKTIEAFLD